jgi:hypothetical protein
MRGEAGARVAPVHGARAGGFPIQWLSLLTYRAPVLVLMLGLAAGAMACGDAASVGPAVDEEEPAVDEEELLPDGVAVSAPVLAPAGALWSGANPWLSGDAARLVYVSARPGTFPAGRAVRVSNRSNGESVVAAVLDGGFDPLPIRGETGDELLITVDQADGSTLVFSVEVRDGVRPRVIRTRPPREATEVPLNAMIRVVFSEPIDPATVTHETLRLLLGSVPVEGTLGLSADGLRAEFVPGSNLAPETLYQLVIGDGIRSQAGDALEAEPVVSFTTGPEGGPEETTGQLSFQAGDRSFHVSASFPLDPSNPTTVQLHREWAVSFSDMLNGDEQVLWAQSNAVGGPAEFYLWLPGSGRITEPRTVHSHDWVGFLESPSWAEWGGWWWIYNATVTFTSVTDDRLEGTLSFTIRKYDDAGGIAESFDVEDGSFDLPRWPDAPWD